MSKQTGILEFDKCILSRLWYTSLNISQINNDNNFLKDFYHNCCIDLAELKAVIENLIHSADEEQYQWIAYILLWKVIDNKSSNINCDIQRNIKIQFDYIQIKNAIELCDNVSDYPLKEFMIFFQNTSIEDITKETSNTISKEILTFLKESIHFNPGIVCWIIKKLISTVPIRQNIVSNLQDIYFFTLESCLEHIPVRKNWYLNHKMFESCSPETDSITYGKYLKIVLCILSKMDIDTNAEIEFLKIVYPMLSKAYHVKDIELALYSKKNDKLFKEWLLLWNETYACSESASTLLIAYKISESIFKVTKNFKILLCEQELLKRISARKLHWLNDILDICYVLTMKRKYSEVELLLSCDLLKQLYPVLLLKVLNDCPQEEINSLENCDNGILICESIKFFLEKCYSDLYSDYDLNELHMVLKSYIEIVKYILHWKRKCFITMRLNIKKFQSSQSDIIEHIISVKQILALLQKHNVLSVLKITTNIHDQDHSAIKNLLEKSGQSETFQAYCCIISALKTILLCEFYNTEHKQIAKYFTDMTSYLSSLFPLSLRIQTIENIFSLLFLRYENFNVTNANFKDDNCNISLERTDISKLIGCEKSGFISNKYIIRDMLHYLWNSTLVATEEIDKLQILGLHTEAQQLHENISILTSTLMDARWKLRFYMRSHFIENIGISQDECDNFTITNKLEPIMLEKLNLPHHTKENMFFYKEDSTSDETKIKSDSSSESGLLGSNTKRRKRSRITTATADFLAKKEPSFINLMLASKESLVLHCLWRNDFQKAREIIEMFHMENTQVDGEIRFSEAFYTFKQDISKYFYTSNITDSSKKNSGTSTLETIRLITQEAVQSSKHIKQLETFLASQELHLRMLNTDINSKKMLTFSVLDLSLTIGKTHQISSNLCDVAMKYLKSHETFDGIEYANFFLKIYQLFYDSKNNMSVTNILCDARIPLYIKEWKERNDIWSDFENNYRSFRNLERTGIVAMQFRDSNNYVLGLKTIKKMSDIFNSDKRYFQNIYSYLQLVCTIIPDINDANIVTVFDLLKTPLYRYFGYQIFDLKIEPDKFETVASNLQVNLIYSILVNACPKISYYNEKNYYNNVKDSGCIILNQKREESNVKNVTDPNQCISEILTELLQVLYDVSSGRSRLDNSCLKNISNHMAVRAVLNKTSSLANLDLSELSVGNETLTFFLNIWNVMFLHANLDVWSNDPPLGNLRRTVSLMSIGYMIGDLGLVTLAALRSKLLGYHANDLKFFMSIEELNELAWQDLDLVQNPRVIFAMGNELYGTPEIRVYETEKLDEHLNDAMRDYVSHYLSTISSDDGDFTNSPTMRRKISFTDVTQEYYQNAFTQNTDVSVNRNLLPTDGFEILNENIDNITCNYTYEVVLRYSKHDTSRVKTTRNTMEPSLWQIRTLRSSLLQYLERHCWLLSYLVQRMHNENSTILENTYDNIKRTACLENLLNSPWINKLKLLFDNNQTLTAIHDSIPVHELWRYFEQRGEDRNMQNSLEIVNALPDSVVKYDTELQRFKDLILTYILSNLDVLSVTKMLQYLYQIKDIHILVQTILHNINKWPMDICEHALYHALQHEHSYKLPAYCKRRINGILCRITIFHKMIPYCVNRSNSTWYDIMYCTEKINSFEIIKSLIYTDQFELCLEWLECQAFSLKIQSPMVQDFLIGLLKNKQQDFQQALKFLQTLPSSQSIKICKGILKRLESINALQFVTNYLLEHCKVADQSKYKKILIGLKILKMLESKDRTLYIHLIKEPLLMLEQLLMNCKIESIQKILNTLHGNLQHADISIGNFDKIIRFYARKSLDFRVSIQRDGIESKIKNIPQSNLEAENNEFIMPVNVPTKEEWVPNDKARECSCCKAVIFSMFNRRHHCRRCGRVVCAMCSQHRMQVVGYPNSVFVRVCDDCKRQTVLQMHAMQSVSSTSNSETFDCWRLTRDERHNRTVREEFSFEYAPNISLCLTILNLHSDHKMYTSFLLDRCDEMKQLLLPVGGGRINPEVDHAVIIKMIRSLLVAAKVKCAKLGFNTGLTHCDRFLSQVDLIAILVQSDCLALIPTDDLDEHTLRKLRDLLTEKEQWTLALDVSTKAGLDTQGVWAAWGKACLKVGYLEQAREKFHHCLDKIEYEDFDDWVVLSYSKEFEKREPTESSTIVLKKNEISNEKKRQNESDDYWKRKEYSKCRPLKDPPLLTELLQILDNLSVHRFQIQQSSQSVSDATQEIFHTLHNLKALSQNQFNTKYLAPFNLTVYYQESLYYLLTYGSYNSILQFFLKHKEFDKCLAYILENDLECDLFLNGVYLYCLKNGDTDKLHDVMKTKDPTLFIWKKYLIFVCHFMERKQYWHILYQIQLFMKDCIRASMTCIHFYTNEVNSYLDLHNRIHLLQDAQKHLESELQIESLSKKRKSISFAHSSQSILAMEMEPSEIDRHINTICRQMEITKFLANCEREDRAPTEFLNLFPNIDSDESQTFELPTLFGNQQQKIHLAVLAILCGRDIGEGFGIAFRIIQDYNLPQQKIYSLAGHVLTLKNDIVAIEQLIKCCRSSGAPNAHVISDHVLTHCMKLLSNRLHSEQNPALKNHIDILIKLIIDTKLRINAYIESKQLKAAYLLAVKHSRTQDIKRILKESDRLGQNAIKTICLKWLQQEPKK